MKFFEPGEPSLTLSQCWSFPRDVVSLVSGRGRRDGEPEPRLSVAAPRPSEPAPAPGGVVDFAEDAVNP